MGAHSAPLFTGEEKLRLKWSDHGLSLSMAFSLLVHLLVLILLSLLLQHHTTVTQKGRGATTLEVRFAQLVPIKQTHPSKKMLTVPAPAPFKIAQASAQDPVLPPSARVVDQPNTSQVAGIAFPGAATTPWPGNNRPMSSLFNIRPPQLDAERIYYQQAMEAQARQQTEQQAQLMIQRLQQLLVRLLNVNPVVQGKCMLAETDGVIDNRLGCDSSALHELLHKDEMNVIAMLIATRNMGKMLIGFAAEHRAEELGIILIYQK